MCQTLRNHAPFSQTKDHVSIALRRPQIPGRHDMTRYVEHCFKRKMQCSFRQHMDLRILNKSFSSVS